MNYIESDETDGIEQISQIKYVIRHHIISEI